MRIRLKLRDRGGPLCRYARPHSQSFVIEEVDGRAEIRFERAPHASRGPSVAAHVGDEPTLIDIELEVEKVE